MHGGNKAKQLSSCSYITAYCPHVASVTKMFQFVRDVLLTRPQIPRPRPDARHLKTKTKDWHLSGVRSTLKLGYNSDSWALGLGL